MKAGSVLQAAALLLATSTLAVAQQSATSPAPMPPAPAALAVPNPLATFNPGPHDLYRSPDGSDRYQQPSPYPVPPPAMHPGGYIPFPYYPYHPHYSFYDYPSHTPYGYAPKTYHRAPRQVVLRGGLVLETIPDLAQVYIDGFYVGLAEEFGLRGRALDLTAGPHHVELRAPGYETLTFSVMIEPNGIVRYRGDMQMIASAGSLPRITPASVSPKSYYVIPNCYAGDKPPTGPLPKGCNLKNLQTRK
jgi:hypothetical protein